MDERVRFVGEYALGEVSMTELCEAYGISRKTGYKWVVRYREAGCAGLVERSCAPVRHGRATAPALVAAIEGLRRERPSWGPRKIVAKLAAREPEVAWPSASTAGEVLKRAGLVSGRRLHRRAPPRLGALTQPCHANHVWRVDHKGWVRLGDGTRCEPLTVTDGFSRYGIAVQAGAGVQEAQVRRTFERAFAEHGLPEVIRSDNGTPFASAGVTGLTRLSAWWVRLGIRHERIDPGVPQQNGGHERFHLTLLEAMEPRSFDQAEQERRFADFLRDYNEERPHEALGQKPPAAFYRGSQRAMPAQPPEPIYPAEAAVRTVRLSGEIRWKGDTIFVSTALVGEAVGVEETEDGCWMVRFCDLPLGTIDTKTRKLRRPVGPDGAAQPPHKP